MRKARAWALSSAVSPREPDPPQRPMWGQQHGSYPRPLRCHIPYHCSPLDYQSPVSLFVAVSEQKKSSSKVVPSRQKEKDEVGLKGPGLRKTLPTHFSDSLFCPYLCSGHPIFLSIHLSLRHSPKPITLIKHVDYL